MRERLWFVVAPPCAWITSLTKADLHRNFVPMDEYEIIIAGDQ
jgi:hypothetical protein